MLSGFAAAVTAPSVEAAPAAAEVELAEPAAAAAAAAPAFSRVPPLQCQ